MASPQAAPTAGTDTPPTPTRRQRLVAPVGTTLALGAATLALHLRDPHVQGSWGFCPSAALGFWCPGCGGLRAVHDLTDGRVLEAASSNLALVVAAPFVLAALLLWTVDSWRGRRRTPSAPVLLRAGVALVAVLALFTVLRNLSGSWLAP